MDKNKSCNGHKCQQNQHNDVKPIHKPDKLEIHLPDMPMPRDTDFVTIPVHEYATLVSAATYFDIIDRWVRCHKYDRVNSGDLLILLGAKEDVK